MPKLTTAEWLDYAEGCELGDASGNVKLLMHEHTPAIINPMVNERMAKDRSCNYFVNMFRTEVQPDGQSENEINRIYHPSRIDKSFSFMQEYAQPCDPMTSNACDRNFCEIPSGGLSTLNQGGWFSWGLKTKPYCLQNFRSVPNFIKWLGKEAEDRARTSAAHMELFWLKVALATTGHKIVLEGVQTAGGLVPAPSYDMRNPLRGFQYSWMKDVFPAVNDPNNIMPLDVATLQRLGLGWSENTNTSPIAMNGEGNGMHNLWIGDDWRAQEVDRFADFARMFMSIENAKMLEGYKFEEGSKTAFGRFILESRFKLPRFAPDAVRGGLVMVQDQIPIQTDVGVEYVANPLWYDAPIRLAIATSKDQAVVLTRPPLSVHGNGIPIPVVPSSGGWYPLNEYDKDCNPHRLLPHWESWNEMGYRPENPDSSFAILYRARTLLVIPTYHCDLSPMFTVESPDSCGEFTTIGCHNKRSVPNSVTALRIGQTDIRCSSSKCGSDTTYRLEVQDLQPLKPNSQSIATECGGTLTVIVEDDAGSFREVQATMVDNDFGYPFGKYSIELEAALNVGDCIRAVRENSNTPLIAYITNAKNVAADTVKFATSSALVGAVAGNDALIEYFNANGVLLGSFTGEITTLNQNLYTYTVECATVGFAAVPETAWAGDIDITKTKITLVP